MSIQTETLQDRLLSLNEKALSIQKFADEERRDLTADESAEIKRLFDEFTAVENQLDARDKVVKLESKASQSAGRQLAPEPIQRQHSEPPKPAEVWTDKDGRPVPVFAPQDKLRDALPARERPSFGFGEYLRHMVAGGGSKDIRNALAEGTDSAGGFLVPTPLASELIDALRARSIVVQLGARTVPLSTETLAIAKVATDPTPAWRAEAGAVSESDPTFARVTFTAKSLAVLVKVSYELLEDAPNMNTALTTVFAGSLAAETDRVALFGSGSGAEPGGVANTANIQSVSMGTNGAAISSYAQILSLMEAIETANATTTGFAMSPRTKYALAGLTASDNQPLMAPSVVSALPMLSSSNVPVDQTQGTASDASTILAGDWSKLMLGVRWSLRIETLRERYAENLQYGFIAHLRMDVQVEHPAALGKLIGIIPA